MSLATKISVLLTGHYVGKDRFGNRYYESRRLNGLGKKRRFVMYHGVAEASKVPPEWFGWLHHSEDQPLRTEPTTHSDAHNGKLGAKTESVLGYHPNFSGTKKAWRPPGSLLAGGKRPSATGDYEAWHPATPLVLSRKKTGKI